jgi:hypothetical protein
MRFAISRREDDHGRASHWLITTDRGPTFRMNCLLSYRQFRREVRRTSGVRLAPMTTVKWFEMVAADGWPHLFRVFRGRS